MPFIFFVLMIAACGKIDHDTLIHMENVPSEYVQARNVDIWLPPGYYLDPEKRYPVLYMHDGQNLFDTATAYGGNEWGVDEWIKKLSAEKKIPEVIVVGIWNTQQRFREYNPQKPFNNLPDSLQQMLIKEYGGPPLSDAYLQFIVRELKPIIDSTYQTLPDRQHTAIMGSSMGGLISAYALVEYSEVFSRAGCLSTHWPVTLQRDDSLIAMSMVDYIALKIPVGDNFKIYFDHGTETLDRWYGPYQKRMDALLLNKDLTPGKEWISHVYEGHEHNEIYWNERLVIPLGFLLGDLK
ncbi:MAG: hypothetical protein KQI35_00615 [Bacteroidetes bacterium]|nr:hypothetical protein [Bacteroidota bacterium]